MYIECTYMRYVLVQNHELFVSFFTFPFEYFFTLYIIILQLTCTCYVLKMAKPVKRALTEIQREQIIQRTGLQTVTSLAKEFGVHRKSINRIQNAKENKKRAVDDELSATLAVRKSQINLDLQTKRKILDSLREGQSIKTLAEEYSVCETTIWRIKKNKIKILSRIEFLTEHHSSLSRKQINGVIESALDKALYFWFLQERSRNTILSGPLLMAKAMEINEKQGGSPKFKASNGWLHRFTQKYNIHQISIQGEKLSSNHAGALQFSQDFVQFLHENEYQLDQVFMQASKF